MNHGVNLIPRSILAARARRRRLRTWIVADGALGAGVAAMLLASGPQASGVVDRLVSEHESARSTLAVAQEQLAGTIESLREARAQQAVARRIGARPDFSGLLQTIAYRLDSRASLEQVLIAPLVVDEESDIGVGGGAGGNGAPADRDGGAARAAREQYQVLVSGIAVSAGIASDYVLRLDETGYFSRVSLSSTSGRDLGELRAVEFRITGTLGVGRLAAAEDEK